LQFLFYFPFWHIVHTINMVYCVSDITAEDLAEKYGKVFGKGDMVVLGRNVVGRVDIAQPFNADMGDMLELSRSTQSTIVVPLRCFDGGKCSNSVAVLDSGRVVCLQDEINAKCGYVSRNCIFLAYTEAGKIGLVIDSDIMYADIWSKYIGMELRYIVHCNHSPITAQSLTMLQALSLAVGCVVIGNWSDQAVVATGGHIADIAVGKLRPLWFNHSQHKGYKSSKPTILCLSSSPNIQK